MTRLVAVLLNPPLTAGIASHRHLEAARLALNCAAYDLVNLFTVPTKSVDELNHPEMRGVDGWMEARAEIDRALSDGDELLGAWGISGLSGAALQRRREQVTWMTGIAHNYGYEKIWLVGGEPRHPSRWHQYVSDKYGRTNGGTLDERLAQVLVRVPLPAYRLGR